MARHWLICAAATCAIVGGCSKPTVAAKQNAAAKDVEAEAKAAQGDAAKADDAAAGESTAMADGAAAGDAEETEKPRSPHAGERLLAAMSEPPKENPMTLAFELDEALSRDDDAARETADSILGVTRQAIFDDRVADYIDGVAQNNPAAAAKLVVWTARAQFILRQVAKRNKTETQGTYAVGRLVMADGEFSPTEVMFQVPITAEGYFATEIGDPEGSLSFRAPGYENLDVPLTTAADRNTGGDGLPKSTAADGASAEAPLPTTPIVFRDLTMQPLAKDRAATLHGRVAPDDAAKAGTASIKLSLGMGPANTPHGGYSPRKSWPEPMAVEVDESGAFDVPGLSPSEYSVSITADDHAAFRQSITLEPGEVHDAGDLKLRSTDLGFYIDAEAPDVPELAWEKDFTTAAERAKAEHRPLMVMMTATWCGPCKMLERDSLSNVWIRKFLEPFVVVQAFEDRDVEEKYGLEGYPTLVFADSAGEEAFRSVGYLPAINFAASVAKGLKAVEQDLPAELQTLVDKEVVTIE